MSGPLSFKRHSKAQLLELKAQTQLDFAWATSADDGTVCSNFRRCLRQAESSWSVKGRDWRSKPGRVRNVVDLDLELGADPFPDLQLLSTDISQPQ